MEGIKPTLITQTVNEYRLTHEKRWRLSVEWIKRHFNPSASSQILEVSHPSGLTDLLKQAFGVRPDSTSFDVRDPKGWSSIAASSYDLVLNTEVVEHLADWIEPEDDHSFRCCEFYKTGMANCVRGCFHALKPGGLMFLTTPNASSVELLASWIYYNSPFSWDPHIRELSFNEAVRLVTESGFQIVAAGTEDPYLHRKEVKSQEYFAQLRTLINKFGIPHDNRGETTCIVARKPEGIVR